uniref:RMT2 domain-containing protein n=1 Tax=Macrostomum lignano TaxID=282301 RepID=A0A1I8IBX6_9PLAT
MEAETSTVESRKRKAASPSRQPPDGSNDGSRLLAETGADPCYQDHRTGMSVADGSRSLWQRRHSPLPAGQCAPWNAVDRQYHCAGEYATCNGHQAVVDLLLNHAAASELLLGALLSGERALGVTELQREYMRQRLTYCGGGDLPTRRRRLRRHDGLGAAAHGATRQLHLPAAGLRVLNVGFGMGIVDTELQKLGPASHTIVEAHPDVLARMRHQGWPDKPGVRIVSGRWQDVVADLGPFDGVFFDTYAEDDLDLHSFHAHLPGCWRSAAATPSTMACARTMSSSTHCPDCGCSGSACGAPSGRFRSSGRRQVWQGVRDRYWHFDTYYLPEVCRPEEEDSHSAAAPMDASS